MIRHLGVGLLLLGSLTAATGTIARADSGSGKPHIRFGGFTVGAGYSYVGGPFWGYPYWGYNTWAYAPWALYAPAYYSYPGFAPGFYTGFAYAPGFGEIKLKSIPKSATVFIDGAYAGNAAKLKSMWLKPGIYQLRVEDNGQARGRKVYVLSGKSLSVSQSELEKATD
jgi:hypothetical protein